MISVQRTTLPGGEEVLSIMVDDRGPLLVGAYDASTVVMLLLGTLLDMGALRQSESAEALINELNKGTLFVRECDRGQSP